MDVLDLRCRHVPRGSGVRVVAVQMFTLCLTGCRGVPERNCYHDDDTSWYAVDWASSSREM